MPMVFLERYSGIPREQRDALEAVMQGTLTALYTSVRSVAEKLPEEEPRFFGDADYSIARQGTTLLYQSLCGGYWAVLAWWSPGWSPADPRVEFGCYVHQGEPPQELRDAFKAGNVSWEALEDAFMRGDSEVDMYFQAMRLNQQWSDTKCHQVDFKSPLLRSLQYADTQLQRAVDAPATRS